MRPRVFVFLGRGRSQEQWSRLHAEGKVFEASPYGYGYAAPHCDLDYSTDRREGRAASLLRRGIGRLLGFDMLHAVHNLPGLRAADVIWTHTEREHLAVAALRRLRLVQAPLIAQSVWLWDRWARFGPIRRGLFKWLLGAASLHTTLSPENARVGTAVLGQRVVVVPYGVDPGPFQRVVADDSPADSTIRVLAPGNDRHRDWRSLVAAARLDPALAVHIASGSRSAQRVVAQAPHNVVVRRAGGVAELLERYAWADVVAVPLTSNLHASGITVVLEALAARRPAAVTRTGGVESYFGNSVSYAEVENPQSFLEAIREAAGVARRPELLAIRAEGLRERGLTLEDFALRHVLLSRYLLGLEGADALDAASAFAPVGL